MAYPMVVNVLTDSPRASPRRSIGSKVLCFGSRIGKATLTCAGKRSKGLNFGYEVTPFR